MDFNEANAMAILKAKSISMILNCPFPNWFWIDFDQTKLILTRVLTIQFWIHFGLISSNFELKFWYDVFNLFKLDPYC
jgi:hypothetical protein